MRARKLRSCRGEGGGEFICRTEVDRGKHKAVLRKFVEVTNTKAYRRPKREKLF